MNAAPAQTPDPVIGIIGGMGPEATVELMRRVIRLTQAKDDSGHMRMLVDNNPKTPSRIAYLLEGGRIDPGPVLAGMARGLQSLGATHLAMPCNTAHHFAGVIRAAVPIPLVDMLEVSFAALARRHGKGARIGVVGSPALRRVGVLEPYAARHGLKLVHPNAHLEDVALRCIRQVKAGEAEGAHGPMPAQNAEGPSAGYAALKQGLRASGPAPGPAALLVCCTEFSVLEALSGPGSGDCIDTLDELAAAVVALQAS